MKRKLRLLPAIIPFLFIAFTFCFITFGHRYPPGIKAELSADWPVPELALPADATEDYVYIGSTATTLNMCRFSGKDSVTDRYPSTLWAYGFDSYLAWDELTDFWDNCLRDAGYYVGSSREPEVLENCGFTYGFRHYYSRDGLIHIIVYYRKDAFALFEYRRSGYSYNVYVFDSVPDWFDPTYYNEIP